MQQNKDKYKEKVKDEGKDMTLLAKSFQSWVVTGDAPIKPLMKTLKQLLKETYEAH